MKPLVAVVCDTRFFDRYEWHCAPETYLRALADIADVMPVLIPALAEKADVDAVLEKVDGVLLTGSKTNVHPERYGDQPTQAHEPFDPRRDETVMRTITGAISRGLPLFAICRGIQELNVALGGSLATEIQTQDGRMDHRAPDSDDADFRFKLAHSVDAVAGGPLATALGAEKVQVNSLHRQGINALAPGLSVEATAPDGTIEAVSVRDAPGFAMGVQWHPEYWAASDPASRQLFVQFGNAVRERHAAAQNASIDKRTLAGASTS